MMRDLGRWVVILTRHPMLWWFNRKPWPGQHIWTMQEILDAARKAPPRGMDVATANATRTVGWAILMLAGLPGVALAKLAGLEAMMIGFIAVCMFSGGMLMTSGFRWSAAWAGSDVLDRRMDGLPWSQRPRGIVARLSYPSSVDAVFATLWSVLLTPAILE